MKANVGSIDRLARIILGALLMYLAYSGTVGPWGWLGAIFLLTGILSSCPIYTALGIRTCKSEEKSE
ncbi:YgaP family membrane protein [Pseudemcibacter aquimaris]|uniref:YgaP family membrane protein n=1 Tax=Pseudemcibacter aquimaris TaxID=2857064 RepID=UPI002012C868|nr:DUF2892 domain-containing protein [Pseudemcibacter aquimaris]MCC3861489.1 DUF2892 domain-containing protein [Pseudemcibacter aquimaris]WDU58258.1 DUF2892 domain-containing protein [Pseudemcibacter aquimaris]